MEGERSYVIAIHDPLGVPSIPAESITGADYVIEFPVNYQEDKLIFVQLKSRKYGITPKQYFAMGAIYTFIQYLRGVWSWVDRLSYGSEYVTKSRNPHNEFLFTKIIDYDLYIPMSSIFRTYKIRQYNLANDLSTSRTLALNESCKLVDFSKPT